MKLPCETMIANDDWQGRRVLVVGLGRFGGGVGVTRWLAERGSVVTVTDQAEAASLAASIESVSGLGVALKLGGHDDCNLHAVDLAVINPGVVKHRSPLFARICAANIPWTTELNLFCERCPAPVVGVTGSFGKSTTCAMLSLILEAASRDEPGICTGVHLGGNIGRSLLGELTRIGERDIVVLEMSNAQLEDVPRINWCPRWGALTNLHPHHLDRYDDPGCYFRAKLNLLGAATERAPSPVRSNSMAALVVGDLCPEAEGLLGRRLRDRDMVVHRVPAAESAIGAAMELSIPGEHNRSNARCALAIARAIGVSDALSLAALRSFAGLPHRLQRVGEVHGVRYFNDSKSTSPTATCVSVQAIDTPIVLIAGGQDKTDAELDAWANVVASRCRVVLCAGESGPRLRASLDGVSRVGPVVEVCDDYPQALARAQALARLGDSVLFSPGAPSFDAYSNFAERGDHFISLVERLKTSNSAS